ncbi:MAG: hypothetical protein H6934_02745 [Burkholderiaceae bacterium]|nr:hypothetical protein [Burkholderiaceae bacterium]
MPYFGDDRVMACTEADMLRWLGEFTGLPGLAFVEGCLTLEAGGFPLTIRVEPAPPRRLGLVVFRATRVKFQYPPAHSAAAHEWITRFDHHTHRGGG